MNASVFLPCLLAVCALTHCSVAESPQPPRSKDQKPAARKSTTPSPGVIAGKKPVDNRLFRSYNAAGSARWNDGWPGQLDLTGVAWNSPRTATAITPRHVIMAGHYPLKVGDTLVFHDRRGTRHSRKLVQSRSLRGKPTVVDIAVGLLDQPLPDSINTYRLLAPAPDYANRIVGGPVLVTENGRRLYIHEIRYLMNQHMKLTTNPDSVPHLHKHLAKGDSGNPGFLILEGELVLVETHSTGGPGAGPFYSHPNVFRGLQNAVRELDSAYRIKTRPLGERYTRLAASRRAERPVYATINPDGSLKDRPKPAKAPAVRRTPASALPATPTTKPATKTRPRVRRVPTPQEP